MALHELHGGKLYVHIQNGETVEWYERAQDELDDEEIVTVLQEVWNRIQEKCLHFQKNYIANAAKVIFIPFF